MNGLSAPVPPGWTRSGEVGATPLWRWRGGTFYAATGDMDLLLFIGVSLGRFDRMDAEEFRDYVTRWE
jgi:hypothetical protein